VIDDARREGVMINVESLYHLQLKPLITKREHLAELRGAVKELGGVQLVYGERHMATTYVTGEAKTVEDRYVELQQQLNGGKKDE
jgi:hypothetical protein